MRPCSQPSQRKMSTRSSHSRNSGEPQLLPLFSEIFNQSITESCVQPCCKASIIIPVQKKNRVTCLDGYITIALTSVVMKSLERFILPFLKQITNPLLDPLQFAYRANHSVDNAIYISLHHILYSLDQSSSYVRFLFVDNSSAFNTILLDCLHTKLLQLQVPLSICDWITDFLTERKRQVQAGGQLSAPLTTNTMLCPFTILFSLYTNDCTSIKLLQFADETTVLGLSTTMMSQLTRTRCHTLQQGVLFTTGRSTITGRWNWSWIS